MTTRNHGLGILKSLASAGVGLVAGAVVTLSTQRSALEELRTRVALLEQQVARAQFQTNLAHQQRLHWELLSKAMDDPELAEVLDIYGGSIPAGKQRQFLFANALYTNGLCYYRMGNLTREEFFGFARGWLQQPLFREYWYATRPHRAGLIDSSDEAEMGRMVDDLLIQLEETDIDEWWVVGDPPND